MNHYERAEFYEINKQFNKTPSISFAYSFREEQFAIQHKQKVPSPTDYFKQENCKKKQKKQTHRWSINGFGDKDAIYQK